MGYLADLRKLVGSRPLIAPGATVLVLREGGLLLNLRSDTGDWGIPGGAMELGETLEETAARELYEETGLTAGGFRLLTVLSGEDYFFKYPNGDRLYSVIGLYLAEGVTGEPRILDGESQELRFFPQDGLPPLEKRAAAVIKWIIENRVI